ncbi:MAG: hypothetical protein AABY83_06580 [Pseudomonadota bacterium]
MRVTPPFINFRSIAYIFAVLTLSMSCTGCAALRDSYAQRSANHATDTADIPFPARAIEAKNRGDLALALANWEVAVLLRPSNDRFQRALHDTRQLISTHIDRAMSEANRAQQEGKYETASAALLRVLSYDPTHAEALRRLRHLELTQAKNLEVAKLEKTRRFYLGPSGAAPTSSPSVGAENPHQLGIELLEQGKLEAAIDEFKSQLQRHPKDARAKHYLAQANLMLAEEQDKEGQSEKALQSYAHAKRFGALDHASFQKRSIDIKQKLADQYYNQGLTAFRENLAKAIKLLEKALQFNPDHAKAAIKLQQAKVMQKNLQRMEQ